MGIFDAFVPLPEESDPFYNKGLPNKLRYTKHEAQVVAPNLLKAVRESVGLINTTVNPDVFFERYGFALCCLRELSKMERLISFTGQKPSAFLLEMRRKRQPAICELIDRMCERTDQKLSGLKTEKGKISNYSKLYSQLEAYQGNMDENTKKHLYNSLEFLKTKHFNHT